MKTFFFLVFLLTQSLILSGCQTTREVTKTIINKEELISLLAGSEVVIDLDGGVRATQARIHMDPNGNMRGENDLGTTTKGIWQVNDKGQWCREWEDHRWRGGCHYLYRIDGEKNLYQYRSSETRLRFIDNN
tara:strand:- start:153 stop:548 length:396 start_codon:yes stop_codon:yes gene_type:complete